MRMAVKSSRQLIKSSITLAVGKRIEQEIREEIDNPCVVSEPAEHSGDRWRILKAGHTRAGRRHQFEILTGRVEAFAVVRDLDAYAKRRVQSSKTPPKDRNRERERDREEH
jgi:hypothetical protein